MLWQELLSAKFANSVVTVHEPLKQDVLVKDGIPSNKITVIANFADDSLFKLKNDYQLNEKIKIIFHGTIAERFGLQDVLKLFSEFESKDNLLLKIIGEGDYSGVIKELIQEYKLESVVDFDNQFYPVTELPGKIAAYDVGLVSYNLSVATEYMLPLKMLEYISGDIEVIAVTHGENMSRAGVCRLRHNALVDRLKELTSSP